MRGVSVKNPERSLAICLVAGAVGGWAVWTGAAEIAATGVENGPPHLKVGIGLLPLILGPLLAINFWRGIRAIAALKAGKRVIARWTLTPLEAAAFRDLEQDRNKEARNWVQAPKGDGPVEVIFGDDAALIGEEYIGLSPTGMLRFNSVRIRSGTPAILEFGVALTQIYSTGTTTRTSTERGTLRLPIAEGARDAAIEVVKHFQSVKAGEIAANPGFWPSRRKFGVGAVVLGALSFLIGMQFRETQSLAPLIAAVAGAIVALGGAIVAAIAWFADPYRNKKFF